jgi:fucose permease
VAVAFLTFFAALGLQDGAFGVGWVYIRDEFGLENTALATMALALTLGFIPASFFSGSLTARYTSGTIFTAGAVLITLGVIGMAVAPEWHWIIVSRFIIGVGTGVLDGGLNAYIATYSNNRIMNWLHACFGIGVTIGPAVMTLLVAQLNLSWRFGFVVVAVVLVGLAVAYFLTRQRWISPEDRKSQLAEQVAAPLPERARHSVFDTARKPMVWVLVLFTFFYAGTEVSLGQWTFPLFFEGRGVPEVLAGQLVSLYWGSFTIGRFLVGFLPNHISRALILRASLGLMLIGIALLWWNPAPMVAYIGLVIAGVAQAPVFATYVGGTPGIVGSAHAGNAIGFQLSMASFGVAVLPGLASVLVTSETFTLEVIPPYVFIVGVVVLVLHEVTVLMSGAQARAVKQAAAAG